MFAPTDSDNPVALYGPAVVRLTVYYRGQFKVPYPDFHHDVGGFVFTPGSDVYSEEVNAQWSGTGFIITANGYLITNAHIAGTEYYKKFGFLLDHAYEVTDLFIDDQVIAYEQYDFFLQSYHKYLVDYGNFTFEMEEAQVTFGDESYPANQVASGDPIGLRTSKDVALLKAEFPKEYLFPTIKLGNSDEVEVGDSVTILGFPTNNHEHPNELDQPQPTSGKIVDLKPMEGWSALQTDADITFGYSGGPALNGKGEVIGVAAFGAISPLTKTTANFLIPINIAHSLLEAASLNYTGSIIDEHYEKGLRHLWKGEYHLSISEFKTVLNLNPTHTYARHYLNLVQQEEGTGDIQTTDETITKPRTSREEGILVKTTTVTKINYETETKTLLSTITQIERTSSNGKTLLFVVIIALILVSATLTLGLLRLKRPKD